MQPVRMSYRADEVRKSESERRREEPCVHKASCREAPKSLRRNSGAWHKGSREACAKLNRPLNRGARDTSHAEGVGTEKINYKERKEK